MNMYGIMSCTWVGLATDQVVGAVMVNTGIIHKGELNEKHVYD